jgi:hypothetical protein
MPKKKRPLIRPQEAGELDPAEIRAVVRAVHVLPTVDGWEVRKGGKKRISVLFETQEEAEKYAHQLSTDRNVRVIVHSQVIPKLQSRSTLGTRSLILGSSQFSQVLQPHRLGDVMKSQAGRSLRPHGSLVVVKSQDGRRLEFRKSPVNRFWGNLRLCQLLKNKSFLELN